MTIIKCCLIGVLGLALLPVLILLGAMADRNGCQLDTYEEMEELK